MAILRKGLREQTPEAETFGIDEALARISTQLMEAGEKSLMSVSDVTPEEVFGLALLLTYAEKLDSDLIKDWVENFLKLRISRMRLGRKELIILGSGVHDRTRQKGSGMADLFAGFGK